MTTTDDIIARLEALEDSLEKTREWLMEVEEIHDALEHKVAIHHSAFTIGALDPPADLGTRPVPPTEEP